MLDDGFGLPQFGFQVGNVAGVGVEVVTVEVVLQTVERAACAEPR
jgi:hypothetical protein